MGLGKFLLHNFAVPIRELWATFKILKIDKNAENHKKVLNNFVSFSKSYKISVDKKHL